MADAAKLRFAALIPLPLLVSVAIAVILVVRHGAYGIPLAAYALAQVVALLAFGMRAEARDLLELMPFLCLGGMLAMKPDWDAPLVPGVTQPVKTDSSTIA